MKKSTMMYTGLALATAVAVWYFMFRAPALPPRLGPAAEQYGPPAPTVRGTSQDQVVGHVRDTSMINTAGIATATVIR